MKRSSKQLGWIVASLVLGTLANVALAGGPGGRSGSGKGGNAGGGHSQHAPRHSQHFGPAVTTRKVTPVNNLNGTNFHAKKGSGIAANGIVTPVNLPSKPKPVINPIVGLPIKPITPIVGIPVKPIKPITPINPIVGIPVKPIKPVPPTIPTPCFPPVPPHYGHHGFCFPPILIGYTPWFGGYGCGPTVIDGAPSSVVVEQSVNVTAEATAASTSDAAAADDKSEAARKSVRSGDTLELPIANLGEKPGQAVLQLGKVSLPVAVNEWKNDRLTVTIPAIGLGETTPAELFVVRADGQLAQTVALELLVPQPAPTATASAAPAP